MSDQESTNNKQEQQETPQGGGQQGTKLEDTQALQKELDRARQEAARYRTQLRALEERAADGEKETKDAQPEGQQKNAEERPGAEDVQAIVAKAVEAATKKLQEQLQQVEGGLESAEKARRAAELKAIQAEFGLPDEMMKRLQGETEAELRQDAEKLAKLVRPQGAFLSPTNPVADGEQGTAALATKLFNMRRGGLAEGLDIVGDLLGGKGD